jgi:hypothetical protein
VKGFELIDWRVSATPATAASPTSTHSYLIQIHGAPQSREDDAALIQVLRTFLTSGTPGLRVAVLIHRPDEVQLLHPSFSDVLSLASSSVPLHLVFLGDKHLEDPAFTRAAHVKVINISFFFFFVFLVSAIHRGM